MSQASLPGLAPDPYRLEPLRPSYTKLARQLEAVARARHTPIALLSAADLADHAERVGWSAATLATARRVAHAHGLDIDPATNPRPRARPDELMLSMFTTTSPDNHPGQQRTAALAALMWHHPAPLNTWRRTMFADFTYSATDVILPDGHRCPHVPAVTVWRNTVRDMHPGIDDARLPFLARIDARLTSIGTRAVEADWARWVDGIHADQWRAWAIDAGATPVSRGRQRHRHR